MTGVIDFASARIPQVREARDYIDTSTDAERAVPSAQSLASRPMACSRQCSLGEVGVGVESRRAYSSLQDRRHKCVMR